MNPKWFSVLYSLLTKAAILGVGVLSVVLMGWPVSENPKPVESKLTRSVDLEKAESGRNGERESHFGSSRIDLNHGEVADFERLPGIGVVLAQRIVDYRETHGEFHTVAALKAVSGIGKARMARLRPLVIVNRSE